MDGRSSKDIQRALDLIDIDGTDFFQSIVTNNSERLRDLIKHGANIHSKYNGKASILLAAEHQHWDCVTVLLEHYPDNPYINCIKHVLLLALKENKITLLKKIYAKFSDASEFGLMLIISKPAFPAQKEIPCHDSDGNTALHWAIKHHNIDFLKIFNCWKGTWCYGKKELITAKNVHGETYLDITARSPIDLSLLTQYRYFNKALKKSSIETLFKILDSELINYSDNRCKKLLDYILSLPDKEKTDALIKSIDVSTSFGKYFLQSKDYKYVKCEIAAALKSIDTAYQDKKPESLDFHLITEERPIAQPLLNKKEKTGNVALTPLYLPQDSLHLLFPSVPKDAISHKEKEIDPPKTPVYSE